MTMPAWGGPTAPYQHASSEGAAGVEGGRDGTSKARPYLAGAIQGLAGDAGLGSLVGLENAAQKCPSAVVRAADRQESAVFTDHHSVAVAVAVAGEDACRLGTGGSAQPCRPA